VLGLIELQQLSARLLRVASLIARDEYTEIACESPQLTE
jgi:hypothetical protein